MAMGFYFWNISVQIAALTRAVRELDLTVSDLRTNQPMEVRLVDSEE